ncbi:MAG: hypothetical protein ABI583_11180 [Betaproteobacteria bacterium]
MPDVSKSDDGGSKLEWRSTISTEGYQNDIKPPPAPPGAPPTATPLNTGQLGKTVVSTEIKLIEPGGQVSRLQFGLTATNDRSVLSRYSNQLATLQFGRTGPGYQIGAGDAALNFSQLGTTLGLRGINVQRQLGDWTISGYGGVVSESWEALYDRTALDNRPARSRFLRNVFGTKVEYAPADGWKTFATAQGFSDAENSLGAATIFQQPVGTRAISTGLSYQGGPWSMTSEVALSRFTERYQLPRRGDALQFDGGYRQATWSLRGGYHDIDPKFVSLSQSVPPGVKEWYLGADWTVNSWLAVAADYRDAISRIAGLQLLAPPADPTLPPPFPIIASSTQTRSLTTRANINFGTVLPGFGLTLANTANVGEDAQQNQNRNRNTSGGFSYSSATWTGSVNYTNGNVTNIASPMSDSTMRAVQAQLGRNYTGTSVPWSFGWMLSGGRQVQRLDFTGAETAARMQGLTLNGQRPDWAQFALTYQGSTITQTTGGPNLATHAVQLDVSRQFGLQNTFKAYLRQTHRNVGDINLRTDERVFGVQLNMDW